MGKRKLLKSIGRKENKRLENHKRMERTIQLQKSFAFLSTALAFDSAGAIQIAASNHLSSFTLSVSTKNDDCQEQKRKGNDIEQKVKGEVQRRKGKGRKEEDERKRTKSKRERETTKSKREMGKGKVQRNKGKGPT